MDKDLLLGLNLSQLKQHCKDNNVKGYSGKNKEQIVHLLLDKNDKSEDKTRQAHGLAYEEVCFKQYSIRPTKNYTSEYDGYLIHQNKEYPVQIKLTKFKSEICLDP